MFCLWLNTLALPKGYLDRQAFYSNFEFSYSASTSGDCYSTFSESRMALPDIVLAHNAAQVSTNSRHSGTCEACRNFRNQRESVKISNQSINLSIIQEVTSISSSRRQFRNSSTAMSTSSPRHSASVQNSKSSSCLNNHYRLANARNSCTNVNDPGNPTNRSPPPALNSSLNRISNNVPLRQSGESEVTVSCADVTCLYYNRRRYFVQNSETIMASDDLQSASIVGKQLQLIADNFLQSKDKLRILRDHRKLNCDISITNKVFFATAIVTFALHVLKKINS